MSMIEAQVAMRIERSAKRVRAYLGGKLLADSRQTKLVWEVPYFPAYYFPTQDVRIELLRPSDRIERSPSRGKAKYFHVVTDNREARDAVWQYPDSPIEELRSLLRLDWGSMTNWFEEDEEVFVHPRNPYTRVDILSSSRRIKVVVNEVTLAESDQPRILFETGLPPRYYLPLVDLRMDLLRSSSKVTQCPYKGTANYWSVQAGDTLVPDLVWTYKNPIPESQKVAGLACFYDEHIDLYVDGELQARPKTMFS